MLKRASTTVHCIYCTEVGHNTRSCKAKVLDQQTNSLSPENTTTEKIPVTCSYCKGAGHNTRTCPIKVSMATFMQVHVHLYFLYVFQQADQHQGKEQSNHVMKKGKKLANSTQPPVQQPLKRKETPLQNASPNKVVKKQAENTHGGIIKPFKAHAQQIMDVHSKKGQKFTSLKNLEAARLKMQKNVGKKR
ncbi:hypothetical protein POM88_044408 [Heracleum sosnowskyi]|uniref:CCHC-type domain-containing protein n=1 Tax=Heracleum sosnowskyi TaxID=360622 RepID=A0AAD8H3T5_9APIA|nr:hypothetical protein POM88_044408 [Heracleum sosnowskyi]